VIRTLLMCQIEQPLTLSTPTMGAWRRPFDLRSQSHPRCPPARAASRRGWKNNRLPQRASSAGFNAARAATSGTARFTVIGSTNAERVEHHQLPRQGRLGSRGDAGAVQGPAYRGREKSNKKAKNRR
jgi:hypothetical protein